MAKLSEALRKGISESKPAINAYIRRDEEGTICTCALGAIVLATFGEFQHFMALDKDLYQEFPQLYDLVESPIPGLRDAGLEGTIIHLNDDFGWSREQIADWLESIGL